MTSGGSSEPSVREYTAALLNTPCLSFNEKDAARDFENLSYHFLATGTHLSMQGVRGAPDWYGFETAVWQLSEGMRKVLRKNKKVRGKSDLLETFARIATDKRFGKGRQPLVLMLGDFGRQMYSSIIAQLLEDEDVYGHAIKALLRDKAFEYSTQVTEIYESTKVGWIRATAKRYLTKLAQEPE